jgi:hypothetical protein
MWPNRSYTRSTKAGIASQSPMWHAAPIVSWPVTSAIAAASVSQRPWSRLATTTDAPAWARPSAIARPRPLVPPVTTATRPVRSNSSNNLTSMVTET